MVMKKIIKSFIIVSAALCLASCSLFELDNFDSPAETLKGKFIDSEGNLVATDPSEGTNIRLTELSYLDKHPDAILGYGPYLQAKIDGSYQDTKIFKGRYELYPYGAFMPFILKTADNDTVFNRCPVIEIKGVKEVDFTVTPFLYVTIDESSISASNGKIEMDIIVKRGVSKDDFRNEIVPAGNYSDTFLNVKDIQLYVGYSPYVGRGSSVDIWSNHITFSGDEFETSSDYGFGKPIHIQSIGSISANRKIYFRAAARMNYEIEGAVRYNYSQTVEWQF